MRSREFIQPTGLTQLSSIFLAVVRVVLIICLLSANPLLPGFGNILMVLFFISVTRHFLVYFSAPQPDNIYNFFLDLATPCLYGFLLYHVLAVYEADLLLLLVSVFLPAIMCCVLFMREPGEGMGKRTFWAGIVCYVLSFILVLNYSFDSSSPVVEKYFLTKKFYSTTGSDANGDKGESFYFDLIHVDSIATSANWVSVDKKACQYYHNSWMYKEIKLENETFIVLDKKTSSNPVHQCSFLVKKINGPVDFRIITELQYSQYEKGDTFNVEKHKGLLGIAWLTYK
jgi:hypothetical protein